MLGVIGCAIRTDIVLSVSACGQSRFAVVAVHDSTQQRLASVGKSDLSLFLIFTVSLLYVILRLVKQFIGNDNKCINPFRTVTSTFHKTDVDFVLQDTEDKGAVELTSVVSFKTSVIQDTCQPITAITLVDYLCKDKAHDVGFFGMNSKVSHFLSLLIKSAVMNKLIPVRDNTARVNAFKCHLRVSRLNSDRGLFGFARSLPKAEIVHQLVDVLLHLLLTLVYRPNLYSVSDKPLYDKGCFAIDSAKTVEHKDKENIKFFTLSRFFQLLNGVTLRG